MITYQVSIRKGEEAPRTFGFSDTRRAQAFAAKMTDEGFRVAIVERRTIDVLREAFPGKFV
jgi:xanthine/CO dehydrogenase XdhC/CoxF family maturation factor